MSTTVTETWLDEATTVGGTSGPHVTAPPHTHGICGTPVPTTSPYNPALTKCAVCLHVERIWDEQGIWEGVGPPPPENW